MKTIIFWQRCLIICFALLIIVYPARGQQVLFEGDITCKGGTEIFPLVDIPGQQTFLLMKDNRSLRCYRFSKDFKLLGTLEGEIPSEVSFATLLGHSVQSDGIINLFFNSSSTDDHDIAIITFDHGNQKVSKQLLELPLKGEFVAGAIGYQERFYIFSAKRSSSTLKMYVFNGNKINFETRSFDFNEETFGFYSLKLSNVLRKNKLERIESDILCSLKLASSKNKLYQYDGKIVITLDNQHSRTELITIDPKTLAATLSLYPQGTIKCGETLTSNSFLHNNFLYQAIYCAKGMALKIENLISGQTVQKFSVADDEEIEFKNTIYQLSGTAAYIHTDRELAKTNQFLRKVAPLEGLVSAYQIQEGIVVRLGGYDVITTTTPATSTGGVSFRDTYPRSIFFRSLLNASTFDHIKDATIPENPLDKIEAYKNELGEDAETILGSIIGDTMFQFGEKCIFGYYHRKNSKYILVGFDSK